MPEKVSMKAISKKLLTLLAATLCTAALWAQKVTFEVSAPGMVEVGEMFHLEFSVVGNASPEEFKAPEITGLSVLAGPTVSHGQNVSIVNGSITSSVNHTYTYVLQATEPGRYTIPPAEVKVEGKTYNTKTLAIEAAPQSDKTAAQAQNQSQGQQHRPSSTLAPDDILMVSSASRTSVYKGQPVRLTLRIYNRARLSGSSGVKPPAFNGFWSQELSLNPNREWSRETYNQKVYDVMTLGEYLLYPQQSGTLRIDPFTFTVAAQIITAARRQSAFDDFFGGGPTVEEVQKELKTQPIQIIVKDLPTGAPAGFSGAVGDFSLAGGVSDEAVTANSAATYTIKITGSGNLPLIQAPKLTLPGSFEQYNTTTKESLTSNSSGISGYRQFEYPFIARAEGNYPIEKLDFSFFNPESERYVTLSIPAAELHVAPGAAGSSSNGGGIVSGLTKEDLKILGKDIRFIKIGSLNFSAGSIIAIGSWSYYTALALIAALFAAAFVLIRRHIKQLGNTAALKGKRANKAALGRLRLAENYKRAGDSRRFLDEMLRALWGYLGDKLNIPAANLTKDNVREELNRRRVLAQATERFMGVIADCEQAQYSPATTARTDELYHEGLEAISEMETILKRG